MHLPIRCQSHTLARQVEAKRACNLSLTGTCIYMSYVCLKNPESLVVRNHLA